MTIEKSILWIENYSNKSDNAGFVVDNMEDAINCASKENHYGINNPCSILTENGKKYKFTLVSESGKILADKKLIKKGAITNEMLKNDIKK